MKPIFKTSGLNKDAYHDIDILAIDVSWIAKKHEFALGQRFKTSDGRVSGHIYGAFKDIVRTVSELQPRRLAFCYDRGYQWRLKILSSYKQARRVPEGEEKEWNPSPDVERLFRGFPGLQLSHPDMEADDMMGWLASEDNEEEIDRDGPLVIYAQDKDLWQLIDDDREIGVTFLGKAAGKSKRSRVWIREEQVRDDFGVGPASLAKLKALIGDPSDGTIGIQGTKKRGKKDALRAFAEDIESENYWDPEVEKPTINAPDWIAEHLEAERDRIVRNYLITDLTKTIQRIDGCPVQETKADVSASMDILAEFECNSLIAQADPFFKRYLVR